MWVAAASFLMENLRVGWCSFSCVVEAAENMEINLDIGLVSWNALN